jgi:lipoate-protein ligase A
VSEVVEELYDYAELRRLDEVTMFVPQLRGPILVLGGSQSKDVLDARRVEGLTLRRRRGGGGLVFLRPGDVWVDWWIPSSSALWSKDVHVSSTWCGEIWRDALAPRVPSRLSVHLGSLEGDSAHRVVCFAGRGPGEVFIEGRKAVGVTQWRVREGIFLSSVFHAHDSHDVLALLAVVPEGLDQALDHAVLSASGVGDVASMLDDLFLRSGAALLLRPDPTS